jgi:DNA-binding MarR family transcriptional regulator
MVDQKRPKRQRELNAALEAIHFGFRAITAKPDERLADLGYSRVHHRILFFIGRHPGCSINELLGIMRVTKQYLHRPLQRLIEDNYVSVTPDPDDRRVKRLRLTHKGAGLENELSGDQRRRFQQVFKAAGPQAEAGWRKVMRLLAESGLTGPDDQGDD